MIALIDCNNFFASCEQAFQPWLRKKPVLVLSSNDGCVIARSQEARELGIPMGVPVHTILEEIDKHNIYVCSSNLQLYVDMSRRVMSALEGFSTSIEVYSIDESFMTLDCQKVEDYLEVGRMIRQTVLSWTGIETSIGIGSTKTLAKIANQLVKMEKKYGGVFVIQHSEKIIEILKSITVENIWGVGRKWSKRLRSSGIISAYDLRESSDSLLRQKFNVTLLRTANELRGIPCLNIEDVKPKNKTIMATRSFGRPMTNISDIEEAVSSFATRAAEKLRKQNTLAQYVYVFVRTKKTNQHQHQNTVGVNVVLPIATAFTPTIINFVRKAVQEIYQEGHSYKKAGVILSGIIPNTVYQEALFYKTNYTNEHTAMTAVDHVNKKYGKGTLQVAAVGTRKAWHPKSEKRSKLYTTKYSDILEVKAM